MAEADFISMFAPVQEPAGLPFPGMAMEVRREPAAPVIPTMDLAQARLAPFRVKALEMEASASKVDVIDAESQKAAVVLAGEIKKIIKKIEETRKDYVGPFNAHVRSCFHKALILHNLA